MGRLTKYENDLIRNKAIAIIRNLSVGETNELSYDELSVLNSFLLIERAENIKLKKYEDLEEQGLLLKLHVPFGETVYSLEDAWQPDERCPEDEWLFKYIKCAVPVLFESWMIEEWGKTVFLTKEEAEKALAEMEKENGIN